MCAAVVSAGLAEQIQPVLEKCLSVIWLPFLICRPDQEMPEEALAVEPF